ncbi:MAG: hypothetical protein WC889_10445 [Myxococcota bacterium]|jgi:hypothetical protein
MKRWQKVVVPFAAVAVGAALAVTAFWSARQPPFAVRFYGYGHGPVRVTAFDAAGERALPLLRVCSGGVCATGSGDGAVVVRQIAFGPDGAGFEVETAAGSRSAFLPSSLMNPGTEKTPKPLLRPISFEMRSGSAMRIGTGTAGAEPERGDGEALARLPVIPYPGQGRLASNMPNRILLWGRSCGGRPISVRTAGGAGTLATDRAGMTEFTLVPSLGESWIELSCGGDPVRAELRDRPQGVAASADSAFAVPGSRISIHVSTILATTAITMDVFRDCAWIDSAALSVKRGETQVEYTLPNEPGLYSFEFYGNVNAPGDDRSRVLFAVHEGDAAGALGRLVDGIEGRAVEPMAGRLEGLLAGGDLPLRDLDAAARAFLSRLELWCGPPPLMLDTHEGDAATLLIARSEARWKAYAGVLVVWTAIAAGVLMSLRSRLRSLGSSEEQLEGQAMHVVVQHAAAMAIISAAMVLVLFTMSVWWG